MLLLHLSIFYANFALRWPDAHLTTQAYVVLGMRRGEVLAVSSPGKPASISANPSSPRSRCEGIAPISS
jgi:hypothetical protein